MTMIHDAPKYDMHRNPVYQIDFNSQASGKRVSATKRRVFWRFGFSNAQAISEGKTGTECRGEEHEISLIWSLTSGKRLITADGREVHFSMGKRTDVKFEASWTMRGGHILKVVAHASSTLFAGTPNFRQFDLFLDGCSFFDMPRMFELGVVDAAQRTNRMRGPNSKNWNSQSIVPKGDDFYYYNNNNYSGINEYDYNGYSSYNNQSQRSAVRASSSLPKRIEKETSGSFAKSESDGTVHSSPKTETSANSPTAVDLLDLHESPVSLLEQQSIVNSGHGATNEFAHVETVPREPVFQTSSYRPASIDTTQVQQYPTLVAESNSHYPQTTWMTNSHMLPATSPSNATQYSAPETYVSNQSTMPFNSTPTYYSGAATAYVSNPTESSDGFATAPLQPDDIKPEHYEQPEAPAPITPSMAPLNLKELDNVEPPKSEMDSALMSLVNLTNINETVETPEDIKTREKKQANQPVRSKPVPPTAAQWQLGSQANLSDIKENMTKTARPKKEIMRTHVFDPAAAQAGMMVAYGQSPPLAQQGCGMPNVMGFATGSHPAYYGRQ